MALERLSHSRYRNNWFDKLSREGNAYGLSWLLDRYSDFPDDLLETALERAITNGYTEITALLLAHQNRHARPGDNPAFHL